MTSRTIWPLPKIEYLSLANYIESRPSALLTTPSQWARLGDTLKLPLVVQAEPEQYDAAFIDYLAQNVPSVVEVIYAVGDDPLIGAAKLVAYQNKLPLVIVPTELGSDQMLEAHVERVDDETLMTFHTGAAKRVLVDWEIILAADPHRRAGIVADMLSIVTGLLDWRYAAKLKRTAVNQDFVPWVAQLSATLAQQTIKLADEIGRGEVAALQTLLDLASLSVQLAHQLGHSRQQEGTEHYFAFALEKQGASASHAECLAPGILLASALHKQDPSALRETLEKVGIRLDQLRPSDLQFAVNDLAGFSLANDLPYAIAHDVDPYSDDLQAALKLAGLPLETGGWTAAQVANPSAAGGETGQHPPTEQS